MPRRKIWQWTNRQYGNKFEDPLEAYWEVALDPMSDDYAPEEIEALDLLRNWAERVRQQYPNGLIPIYWYVQGKKTFERMPFQFTHPELMETNFLTHFTWPVNVASGERVNWLTLPVVNKRWNKKRVDKGGFIQEATGWKPSILQPFVYLPSLMSVFSNQL